MSRDGEPRTGEQRRRSIRSTVLMVLAALLLVVCLQNLDETRVFLLFWQVEMPLILLLAIVALLGAGVGWIGARLRRNRSG